MSNARKGVRRERQADGIYSSAGYSTYRPENASYGDNDVFNLFDMLAFCPRSQTMRFVQIKSNRAKGVESWVERARPYGTVEGVTVDFVVCYDNEGWRLIEPTESGYRTAYDGRTVDASMGVGLTEYLRGSSA